MSGNLVKNYRKKPQRNLPCKETRNAGTSKPKQMSFFVDLTSAQSICHLDHRLGCIDIASFILSDATLPDLAPSKAEIEKIK